MRVSQMNQTVIFDLDGTLVDSFPICISIIEEMIRERGHIPAIDTPYARSLMSHGGVYMVSTLLGEACSNPKDDLAEFRSRYSKINTGPESLFDGVEGGLGALVDHGFELAICSNKPQFLCDQVLETTDIKKYFKLVVGGDPSLKPKPAPDSLAKVISLLGRVPVDCQYVGDSEVDHETASILDVPFIFVSYGYAKSAWAPTDCRVYDRFVDVTNKLVEISENVQR